MNERATHEIELNFHYLHYRDAKAFTELANKERSKLKSLYARHAILSVVFASEALINRIINDFYIPKTGDKTIEKLSIIDKWYIAPLTCAENKSMDSFDSSKEPLQSFTELIKIRNWLVHPKPGKFVNATTKGATITLLETGEEVPWIDTIHGKAWPQTKFPVNPFELTEDHAKKALKILDQMTDELKKFLSPKMNDKWLREINFVNKDKEASVRVTIDSLWGGYTPE
jgi:hypothetical protein